MMETMYEDRHLLLQVRNGDSLALRTLHDKYRLPVVQTALAITHDARAAEDVLQRCFQRLRDEAGQLDLTEPLAPWLYRTAITLSQDRVNQPETGWPVPDTLLDRFDRLVPPEQAQAVRDQPSALQRALEALPGNQRVVLILYYLGGLRLKEIARVLACPVGTVKSRLHYGRAQLRRTLTGRFSLGREVTYGRA